jgi:DNA polymerase III subunit delta'
MSFNDILNQAKAKEILAGQIKQNKIAHAYLFLGNDGVGRKKTAMEFAKVLNCQGDENCQSCRKIDKGIHPDVQLVDFEWQARFEDKDLQLQKSIKIDTVRELQKRVNLKPGEGKWRVFIIEPAEKITLEAANSLLKTLEEPPAWTLMILLAKNKENLLPTIVSRAQVINFGPLDTKDIRDFLITKYGTDKEKAETLAVKAEGSLGAAVRLLESDDGAISGLWSRFRENSVSAGEVLSLSQSYSKNARALLNEFLNDAKLDFRDNPAKHKKALENIMLANNLLGKNVNPQMVLDNLFLKLCGFDNRQ